MFWLFYALAVFLKWLVVEPSERKARWPKTDSGDDNLHWEWYSLERNATSGRACVNVMYVRIRLWPLWRDDSSRVLIGAAGRSRSDWRRRTVGALIGQSACRLLACACEQQSIARVQGLAAACKAATT